MRLQIEGKGSFTSFVAVLLASCGENEHNSRFNKTQQPALASAKAGCCVFYCRNLQSLRRFISPFEQQGCHKAENNRRRNSAGAGSQTTGECT